MLTPFELSGFRQQFNAFEDKRQFAASGVSGKSFAPFRMGQEGFEELPETEELKLIVDEEWSEGHVSYIRPIPEAAKRNGI